MPSFQGPRRRGQFGAVVGNLVLNDVESRGSWPAMAPSDDGGVLDRARASGPIWSSEEAKAIRP